MEPVLSKEFLDIQADIECVFTLKRVRDMIRTYTQMNCTDKYSQHSQLNYLASLAKWFSVPLRTRWLWVRVPLESLKELVLESLILLFSSNENFFGVWWFGSKTCLSSFSDCYKLDISMFSYILHVFSKNKIIHQLEKIFFKSLFHIFV